MVRLWLGKPRNNMTLHQDMSVPVRGGVRLSGVRAFAFSYINSFPIRKNGAAMRTIVGEFLHFH